MGAQDAETERVRRQLLEESYPRLQMMLLLTLAGLGAFLGSATLLRLGMTGMGLRYLVATAFGYVVFLVMIRLWLSYKRGDWSLDTEALDGVGLPSWREPFTGRGGRFGGGGASGSLEDSSAIPDGDVASHAGDSTASALDAAADADEGWPILVVLMAVAAGVVALGFVVYASPVLFAEALLDAAVVGVVYRRSRRRKRSHWAHGVLRRTWLPAAALGVVAAVTGYCVQWAVPEAQSIGVLFRDH